MTDSESFDDRAADLAREIEDTLADGEATLSKYDFESRSEPFFPGIDQALERPAVA